MTKRTTIINNKIYEETEGDVDLIKDIIEVKDIEYPTSVVMNFYNSYKNEMTYINNSHDIVIRVSDYRYEFGPTELLADLLMYTEQAYLYTIKE